MSPVTAPYVLAGFLFTQDTCLLGLMAVPDSLPVWMRWDRALLLALRDASDSSPLGPAWLEESARNVSALGSITVVSFFAALAAGLFLLFGKRIAALAVLASFAGALVLENVVKFAVNRPRPDEALHAVRVFTSGFPSGHALVSAAFYLTLATISGQMAASSRVKTYLLASAVLLVLAIGFTRLYLGVHYPTDVLAGWGIGALWAWLCLRVMRGLQNRTRKDRCLTL